MAKSKDSKERRQQSTPTKQPAQPPFAMAPVPAQIGFAFNPTGRMEPKDIINYKEGWSEYTLDDGSIIRIKGVLLDVKRALDQFGPEGDPIYVFQIAMVQQLRAPDHLKKGYVETDKQKSAT